MYMYVCMCIYIYTHTCIHVYKHTKIFPIAPHGAKETEDVVAPAEALAVTKAWKMKGCVSSICSLDKRV